MPARDDRGEATLFEDDAARAGYVRSMFGEIAGRYDLMNTIMTGGRHHAWRTATARALVRPGAVERAAALFNGGGGAHHERPRREVPRSPQLADAPARPQRHG